MGENEALVSKDRMRGAEVGRKPRREVGRAKGCGGRVKLERGLGRGGQSVRGSPRGSRQPLRAPGPRPTAEMPAPSAPHRRGSGS